MRIYLIGRKQYVTKWDRTEILLKRWSDLFKCFIVLIKLQEENFLTTYLLSVSPNLRSDFYFMIHVYFWDLSYEID